MSMQAADLATFSGVHSKCPDAAAPHKTPGQVIERACQMQHAACPMQSKLAEISCVMLNHALEVTA